MTLCSCGGLGRGDRWRAIDDFVGACNVALRVDVDSFGRVTDFDFVISRFKELETSFDDEDLTTFFGFAVGTGIEEDELGFTCMFSPSFLESARFSCGLDLPEAFGRGGSGLEDNTVCAVLRFFWVVRSPVIG